MVESNNPPDAKPLVDAVDGRIDRAIFVDEQLYAREIERIFSRAWLLLGHDSIIAGPNDYFLTFMGVDSVILYRDARNKPHAFLNMCRRCGNRILYADRGNVTEFICRRDGWTYDATGALIAIPEVEGASFDDVPKSHRALVKAAKMTSYAGFIFATWNSRAPTLETYLGDMRWYLDTLVDRREGGVELIGPVKWMGTFNWKIAADNFLGGQFYASIIKPNLPAAVELPALAEEDPYSRKGFEVAVANGHGIGTRLVDDSDEFQELLRLYRTPALLRYEQSIRQEMAERLGDTRANRLFPHNATIFPNVSFLWDSPSVHIWHPRGPDKTEVWSFAIVDKAAPDSVKAAIRGSVARLVGPSGALQQDTVDNWGQATQSAKSVIGKRHQMDISMGAGREMQHPILPGTVVPRFYSEVAQRGMYQFWSEMMDAKSWKDVPIVPPSFDRDGKVAKPKSKRER